EDYTDAIVLKNDHNPGSIVVTPKMQGRVMSSTVAGDQGKSLGWVNHELIATGKIKKHFTPYGGEDRFWLGPEGGQFSIFITPGKEMKFDNWYVPAAFNTEPWKMTSKTGNVVTVEKEMTLSNYSGMEFDLQANRTIRLLDASRVQKLLNVQIPDGVQFVAYQTENRIENTGEKPWTKETGTVSIWILSQFTPAPGVTVAIPFKKGSENNLGPIVTTAYFGEISSQRLKVDKDNGIVYFKMDGKKRRKLGLSPQRSRAVEGSYDETNHILTIMQFNKPQQNPGYVNQLWKHQEHPFNGNVEFAYNDGPLEDGSQLGPFFEMESSSPAAFLAPGDSITHNHRIFHFSGSEPQLSNISNAVLGVSIEQIKSAF
ncbi:MAG TPA: DUF6786 family protein, partial [Balneolaceae bacterium]|nr:DUF6786 family protein [Balneolaceae bacterium]